MAKKYAMPTRSMKDYKGAYQSVTERYAIFSACKILALEQLYFWCFDREESVRDDPRYLDVWAETPCGDWLDAVIEGRFGYNGWFSLTPDAPPPDISVIAPDDYIGTFYDN